VSAYPLGILAKKPALRGVDSRDLTLNAENDDGQGIDNTVVQFLHKYALAG
jgi:hypothetical protein